ncbi:MAG TPA: metabolite traffic protein EboE [Planctomycetota bacterium]|jgi:hypothetical protein
MGRLKIGERTAYLAYSTNVHPAETLAELSQMLRQHVGPISRGAFGPNTAAINLRLGIQQIDDLLGNPALPTTSTLSDDILKASPTPACQELLDLLKQLDLAVVSINAFPIRNFHSPRVKEQVYSPPWTDGGRALYSLKIAKVMAHFMTASPWKPKRTAISVPSGVYNGLYADSDEIRAQCAHFLTECVRELYRLERLTGCTVQLGLEPEPLTTGETCAQFIEYYGAILFDARQKFALQLGLSRAQAEELARRFLTVNLDLCHQAVEFEDPLEDLKQLKAAGVPVSGLHLSAALKLKEPGKNLERLKPWDEPRYLHQVVAHTAPSPLTPLPRGGEGNRSGGELTRFEDLPHLWDERKLKGKSLSDFDELRCHFHVPLFAEFSDGALSTTRDCVGPAARYALREGMTDNFVVETYTWNVLAALAREGNAAAKAVMGEAGIDVDAGIVKELQWANEMLNDE